MPKMKTKKIVSKRFNITATGKVIHRVQGRRHLRRKKSASAKRRQDRPAELKGPKAVMVKQYLRT